MLLHTLGRQQLQDHSTYKLPSNDKRTSGYIVYKTSDTWRCNQKPCFD